MVRCRRCKEWFPLSSPACPRCGQRPIRISGATVALVIVGFYVVLFGVIPMIGARVSQDRHSTQPASVTPPAPAVPEPAYVPAPQPRWRSIVGRVQAGMKVYWQDSPTSQPSFWFEVLNPFVEGSDGVIYMEVRYESGNVELIDRRAKLRSPAALAGQMVYWAGG